MLHPFSAHFAVALPLLATVLSLAFLFMKKEYLTRSSTHVIVLGAIAMVAAYFTGDTAGYDVWESVTKDAQSLIEKHASLGLYVTIVVVLAALVKAFACIKKNKVAELIALALLIISSVMILNQGKMGGELVYTYGAGVEKQVQIKEVN